MNFSISASVQEPDGPWQAYRRRAGSLSWAPYGVRIEMMKKSSKRRRLGIESMVAMNPKRKAWDEIETNPKGLLAADPIAAQSENCIVSWRRRWS